VTDDLSGTGSRWASTWARRRRAQKLLERFPDLGEMRVLDLGGEAHTWTEMEVPPREVILLNIPARAREQQQRLGDGAAGSWIRAVEGDACDPPEKVRSDRFDLVYSNSVIEHVGGHRQREAFAWFAGTLGESYWIQTPNRNFPIEPHWACPGFQFLPRRARAAVTLMWPIGNFTHRRDSLRQRMQDVLEIELLSRSELEFYFPHAVILRERVAGLVKSLIAVG